MALQGCESALGSPLQRTHGDQEPEVVPLHLSQALNTCCWAPFCPLQESDTWFSWWEYLGNYLDLWGTDQDVFKTYVYYNSAKEKSLEEIKYLKILL